MHIILFGKILVINYQEIQGRKGREKDHSRAGNTMRCNEQATAKHRQN